MLLFSAVERKVHTLNFNLMHQISQPTPVNCSVCVRNEETESNPSYFRVKFPISKMIEKHQRNACCAEEWYRIHNRTHKWHTQSQDHWLWNTLFGCMLTNAEPNRVQTGYCCIAHFGSLLLVHFGERKKQKRMSLCSSFNSMLCVFFFHFNAFFLFLIFIRSVCLPAVIYFARD